MANKRLTKKQVKNICGGLITECALALQYMPNIDNEKMYEVIEEIINLQVNTLKHLTIVFDKSARDFQNKKEYTCSKSKYFKAAYDSLLKEFNSKIIAIVNDMNKTLP